MIVFTREILVDAVLTDADSTPTISIIRTDTNATVVATTSTGINHDSTGNYSYTYSGNAGVTYRATWTLVILGDTITSSSDSTEAGASGYDWYYATQADVEDAISSSGLRIMSNMENTTTTTNDARILRAGVFADKIMNGRLAAMGFTTPVDLSDAGDAEILKQISVYIVLVQLGRWRVLQTPSMDGSSMRNVLQKLGDEWMKAANDLLASIDNRNLVLSAERSIAGPSDNSQALDIRGIPLYSQASPLGGIWGFAIPPLV